LYVGLYTAAPTDAGGGTQVTGGSYARVSVAFTVSGTGTLCTNSAAVEFAAATASWGTIVAVGVFDASTSGNLLAWADLAVNKTIESGDIFRIPTGDLDITLS
jgi:threonine dehydrogenase-like Zn-dependent dehydrogenase